MPATGRFFITPHAVRRFIKRVRPGASYNEALGELIRLSDGAHLVKRVVGDYGDDVEIWRTGKPLRMRLVVAPTSNEWSKGAVVTVLWKEHRQRYETQTV